LLSFPRRYQGLPHPLSVKLFPGSGHKMKSFRQ
jgi:hypothetical protein